MLDNILKIVIVFANENGDYIIDANDIKNFEVEFDSTGYQRNIKKLTIDFLINNESNGYETQALLFRENKINQIIVDYISLPSVSYALSSLKQDNYEEHNFEYDLQVSNAADGRLYVSLQVNDFLFKNIIKTKDSDVKVIWDKDEEKPYFRPIKALVGSYLILRNNGKLKHERINLRWLNADALKDAKRIELERVGDEFKILKDSDLLYLNEYFGEVYGKYPDYLNSLQKLAIKNIKLNTANRGCDVACIYHYKYRINKELGMFNILIEYVCGKTPVNKD